MDGNFFLTIQALYNDLLPEEGGPDPAKRIYLVAELLNHRQILVEGLTRESLPSSQHSIGTLIIEGYWIDEGKNAQRVSIVVREDFVLTVTFYEKSPFPDFPQIGFRMEVS